MKRVEPPANTATASLPYSQKQPKYDFEEEQFKDSFVDTFHKTLLLVHSHQREDEMVFSRSLDSGIRSLEFSGFEIVPHAKRPYAVFRVQITTATSSWRIFRRYSEFAALAQALNLAFSPPKTYGLFASADLQPKFLAKRQAELEEWLKQALVHNARSPEMIRFLVARANCSPDADSNSSNSSTAATGSKPLSMESRRFSNSSSDDSTSTGSAGTTVIGLKPAPLTPVAAAIHPKLRAMPPATATALTTTTSALPVPTPPRKMTTPNSSAAQHHHTVSEADFEKLKLLGEGTFGRVFLVRKRGASGALFAMKILEKQHVIGKHQVEHTKTERSVLARVRHPFIVRLHYAFQTPAQLYFVIDFCAGGELFGLLQTRGKFPEPHCRFYAAEIALAIGYLHSLGIVYRDLKPENVLIQSTGHIQLVDFGLSKEGITQTSEGSYSMCGTPEYLAPEIITRLGHGKAVDWWSLGSLLFEMLTGLPPWYNKDRRILFHNIQSEPLQLPEELSQEAKSILSALLTRDPLARLGSARGLDDIKQHAFFAGFDFVRCLECKLLPPFVPKLAHEADTSHFDEAFTSTDVRLRRPDHAYAHHPPVDLTTFSGFSYIPQTPFSPQLTATSLRVLSPPPPLAFRTGGLPMQQQPPAQLSSSQQQQQQQAVLGDGGNMRLLFAAAAASGQVSSSPAAAAATTNDNPSS